MGKITHKKGGYILRIRLMFYPEEKVLFEEVIEYLKSKFDVLDEKTYPARNGKAKNYYAFLDWKGLGQKHLDEIKKNYQPKRDRTNNYGYGGDRGWSRKRKSITYVREKQEKTEPETLDDIPQDEYYGDYYEEPFE